MWTNGAAPHDYACPMRTKSGSIALALTLTLAGTVLSGCGLFATPETLNMTPADSGIDAKAGDFQIQNAIIIVHEDGSVSLTATLLNNSAETDNVNSITFNGKAAKLTPADQTITSGGIIQFGYNSPFYADLAQAGVIAGESVKVTVTMASGQRVIVRALAFSSSDPLYTEVSPAPVAQ